MIIAGFECTECFVHQINKVISIACKGKSENEKIEIFKKAIKFLGDIDFNNSPPEIARQLYNYLYEIIGNQDPFRDIKNETNQIARKITKEIFKNDYSLEDYVKFSVAGNVIDFGVAGNEFKIENIKNFSLHINHFNYFYKILKKAKNLLFIVDNSGEVIFDYYLLKKIKNDFPEVEITVAGRDKNIINDMTKDDLITLGFNEDFNVISTGYSGAGVLIKKCSKIFKELFYASDLIIAKGQGNFETLYGEKDRHLFFAFKIKCKHVENATKIPEGSNVFIYNKI